MWRYRVVLKGKNKDLEFDLPDNRLLLEWQAWTNGDTTKPVGSSVESTVGAVVNFPDVMAMTAHEFQPRLPVAGGLSQTPISQRASRLFGSRGH
jgi:hypothetical protein